MPAAYPEEAKHRDDHPQRPKTPFSSMPESATGTQSPAEIICGEHQVLARAAGSTSTLTITSADSNLCVGSMRVGTVVPRDLPYGGGVDITDQLQALQ